jgi:glutathione S-transferase
LTLAGPLAKLDRGRKPAQSPERDRMSRPVLSGPAFSTHVMAARLAFEEKGVPYEFEDYDPLADKLRPAAELARLAVDRMPVLRHDGFALYDAATIMRYADEAFPGPSLQPAGPRERACMNQVLVLVQDQLQAVLVRRVALPRVVLPMLGAESDEPAAAAALPVASRCIAALETLLLEGQFLIGPALSLADLYLLPIFAYFAATPEAAGLIAGAPRLQDWWRRLKERPSYLRLRPTLPSLASA